MSHEPPYPEGFEPHPDATLGDCQSPPAESLRRAAERDLETDKLRTGPLNYAVTISPELEISELKRRLDEVQRDRDSLKQRNTFLETDNAKLAKANYFDTSRELAEARVTIDRQKEQIRQLEAMVYGDMPSGMPNVATTAKPRQGEVLDGPLAGKTVQQGPDGKWYPVEAQGLPPETVKALEDALKNNPGVRIPVRPPTVLEEAAATVEDRMKRYGSPAPMFQMLADLWTSYLEPRIKSALTGRDAALMCALLKIAREGSGGPHHDNLVDLAGYARCAELASVKPAVTS